ncbi:hypothetical protein PP7435_CHR4-0588 [Komagataella phaffii CBS 7435]|uniref:Uncharacterized protein n=2 Tax=Komagataella phaffii TaxID=460519 RepID=C4R7S2_KOMPG|nr:uncharacterized protein PAS_chr4_0397 [Komagataella phaffii GS115]AOA64573.1 GQ67_04748T0 [Komagataella phaffii]CAH2450970.1 hypothetical protein BQ9382_C4-3080 [Komagataella phaffii CBS 7435]AOA69966.1 GQ68_04720T0 [Komagataella phaffii GS115]CAY71647.1 Protein of unknown function [Komagataella phaffii GS115]CCA40749.1 hypothetical protein PP7435_CHR4-0588 [Komagataella phaffii CBS 7435]
MAFISAANFTYIRLGYLLTLSFLLLKDPVYLVHYPMIILLTRAMNLPELEMDELNPIFGLISVLILLYAVHDLIPLLEGNVVYFRSIVPVRVSLFLILIFYCYVGSSYYLCNGLIFSFLFMEIWFNFFLYSLLNEEKEKESQQESISAKVIQDQILRGDRDDVEEIINELGEQEFENIMSDLKERGSQ